MYGKVGSTCEAASGLPVPSMVSFGSSELSRLEPLRTLTDRKWLIVVAAVLGVLLHTLSPAERIDCIASRAR